MKRFLFYLILTVIPISCFSQLKELSENECKFKIDSIYKNCSHKRGMIERSKLCLSNPNNGTSLENLYYLRRKIGKEDLQRVLNNLNAENKSNIYAKSLDIYINTPQVKEGGSYYDFTAKTLNNENFTLSEVLKKKDVLIIFEGLDCMGKDARQELRELYSNVDLNKVEVVSFLMATNEEDLKGTIKKYDVTWLAISDYQGVLSKPWLAYFDKGTPTTVYINTHGKVLVCRVSLVNKAMKLLKDHIKI